MQQAMLQGAPPHPADRLGFRYPDPSREGAPLVAAAVAARTIPSGSAASSCGLARHNSRTRNPYPQVEPRFLKFFGRGTMLLDLARWWPHRRIDFKFDTASSGRLQPPPEDRRDRRSPGGVRRDRHDHRALGHARAPRATNRAVAGRAASAYEPWHDATMMLEGEVAGALGNLVRDRWRRAGGNRSSRSPRRGRVPGPTVWRRSSTMSRSASRAPAPNTTATTGSTKSRSCSPSQIARAEKFIYAESQYFSSRVVSPRRSRKRLGEGDPPEVVVVHPKDAEGWIEQEAMDIGARPAGSRAAASSTRATACTSTCPTPARPRSTVHAKLLIVDDTILRIGSANFNNRSMGLDSECDVFIDCAPPGQPALRCCDPRSCATRCSPSICGAGGGRGRAAARQARFDGGDDRGARQRPPAQPAAARGARTSAIPRKAGRREVLDPETPEEMFEFLAARKRGLFRRASLLSRAMAQRRRETERAKR